MKFPVLAKTASWYIFHFAMVTTLGKLITSEWTTGLKLASAEMLFETFLYYWHEHLWITIRKKYYGLD